MWRAKEVLALHLQLLELSLCPLKWAWCIALPTAEYGQTRITDRPLVHRRNRMVSKKEAAVGTLHYVIDAREERWLAHAGRSHFPSNTTMPSISLTPPSQLKISRYQIPAHGLTPNTSLQFLPFDNIPLCLPFVYDRLTDRVSPQICGGGRARLAVYNVLVLSLPQLISRGALCLFRQGETMFWRRR